MKLCLNMIVKNEAANMPRCLASVEPWIACAAITDTGSTDDTIKIITDFFAQHGKPCYINEIPPINVDEEGYSVARNAALRHARSLPDGTWDYILLCDADMELVVEGGRFPKLTAPTYALMQDSGKQRYWNVRLLRCDQTVEYVGLTHECLKPQQVPTAIGGLWYRDHETGANRADKYRRDAKLLKRALLDDPMNPRSVFYMIQALHGLGAIERAREMCDFRVQLGGLEEETWLTKIQIAKFDEALERDHAVIAAEFLDAYEFRPVRAEALAYLSAFHRKHGRFHTALIYAREAAGMPFPAEILMVDVGVYEWAALDDVLGCALMCGAITDARWAARKLKQRTIPKSEQDRINGNIELALKGKP